MFIKKHREFKIHFFLWNKVEAEQIIKEDFLCRLRCFKDLQNGNERLKFKRPNGLTAIMLTVVDNKQSFKSNIICKVIKGIRKYIQDLNFTPFVR